MAKHQHLWLDLQTTALHPSDLDVPHIDADLTPPPGILECAIAWVADDVDGDFAIVEEEAFTLRADPYELAGLHPRVLAIHTASGLLRDCAAASPALTEDDLDTILETMIVEKAGPSARDVQLAGWGIALDHAWIKARCPRTAARLHYQPFDAASLEHACAVWVPDYRPQKPTAKRSRENLRQTIAIARRAVGAVRP